MANDIKLIDFGALGEVVNNLIDKLASAIGWTVVHDTPKKVALTTYIDEIKNSDLPPLEKAARISNAKKDIKEYINQQQIVFMAAQNLSPDASPEALDDDWLASFMDKARLISDDEVQMLWAKILAGEAEQPGTYSLRTLETVKNLSKKEASLFQEFARTAVFNGDTVRVVNGDKKFKNRFHDVLKLEECGLLSSSVLLTTIMLTKEERKLVLYDQNICAFFSSKGDSYEWQFNSYAFTQAGVELYKAVDIERDEAALLEDLKEIGNQNPEIKIEAFKVNSIIGTSINYNPLHNLYT